MKDTCNFYLVHCRDESYPEFSKITRDTWEAERDFWYTLFDEDKEEK